MYFHGARFSNYEAWLSDPVHIKPSAQVVWPVVGQEILNGDVGGGFQGIQITSGFFQLWRASGITSELQLYTTAIGGLVMAAAMFFAGWFHYHKAAPKLEWFQNVESMLNHHLAGLLGLGSLSWAGHQIHVSLPVNKLLDAGVDPKEIPLPHEFLLNRAIMQDLYPSFAKGLAPFFTLQWGEYSDFLTFNGGSVLFGPLEILISLLLLSKWRKPIQFGNSIPFATKNEVFGCNEEQNHQLYVPLQSSVFSNPKFFGTNEKYRIKDYDGVEKILQLPKFPTTKVQTFFKNKNDKEKGDFPSLWFLYNHKVWNSFRENDENYNTWQKLQKMPAIYQMECKQTGKKYIGETQNIRQRFRSTYNALQHGKHASPSLQTDWKKFGSQNFVFTILYMDTQLAEKKLRKKIEAFFMYENKTNIYNEVQKYRLNCLKSIEKTRVFLQEWRQVHTILGWFDAGMTVSKEQLRDVFTKYDQPGIYVILSLQTKKIYIGESQSLKKRFYDTRKMLHNGQHSCKELMKDVQKYGIHSFCFIPLHYGTEWDNGNLRLEAEQKCISLNCSIVYNTQHSGKTKQKPNPQFKEKSNFLNGFSHRFLIEGRILEGFSIVRSMYGISRKEIICRVNDNENFPDWQFVYEDFGQFSDLPQRVYLVQNKVFNSKRSVSRHPDFLSLSRTAVVNRFNSINFPDWQEKTKVEFLQLKKSNPFVVYEFMWQRSNDHPSMKSIRF
jgi:group I intron endonuclease